MPPPVSTLGIWRADGRGWQARWAKPMRSIVEPAARSQARPDAVRTDCFCGSPHLLDEPGALQVLARHRRGRLLVDVDAGVELADRLQVERLRDLLDRLL